MKKKAPRNRTLTCSEAEINRLPTAIFQIERPVNEKEVTEKLVGANTLEVAQNPPNALFSLLVLDPSYKPTLKPDATIYVCSDEEMNLLGQSLGNEVLACPIILHVIR